MHHISPLVTFHNSKFLLRLFRQPRPRQIPNVHLAGLFHLNPRVHGHTRMLPPTTSTLPSTRLTLPKPRPRPRPQIMCSVTLISQHNYSRSRHPLHIPPPLPTLGTHIRNHRSHNTRNMRQVHRVSVAYLVPGSYMLTCHFTGPNNASGPPQQSFNSPGSNVAVSSHLNPNPPSNAYYPNSRARANTINHMDRIPPALARLQHMSQDVISGRNALTPVLNRDDAIKEWERRQSGKAAVTQPYPQLEYLQQQAELAAASGITNWQQPATRYQPAQSSGLAHQYHPATAIVVDDERRDAIMSNVRATAQGQGFISNPISNPPAAYTGAAATAGSRFTVAYPQQPAAGSQSQSQQHPSQPPPAAAQQQQQQQQQQSPASPFDSLDRRPDLGGLFVPLQPDHYPTYTGNSVAGGRSVVGPPAQAVPPSFYDTAVAQQTNAAQQRNPFSGDTSSAGNGAPASGSTNVAKDRRGSGIEFWPR
jgi:dual specificity protein kinase YAK1